MSVRVPLSILPLCWVREVIASRSAPGGRSERPGNRLTRPSGARWLPSGFAATESGRRSAGPGVALPGGLSVEATSVAAHPNPGALYGSDRQYVGDGSAVEIVDDCAVGSPSCQHCSSMPAIRRGREVRLQTSCYFSPGKTVSRLASCAPRRNRPLQRCGHRDFFLDLRDPRESAPFTRAKHLSTRQCDCQRSGAADRAHG